LKDVKADEYDVVVFVGGSGAKEYWNDLTAHSLAKSAAEKGKLVCAICIAPVTLANAGLLEGKKATVWKGNATALKQKGATYTGADVETDGKFITADGPESAAKFGRAIVRALGG
jgi:protease I